MYTPNILPLQLFFCPVTAFLVFKPSVIWAPSQVTDSPDSLENRLAVGLELRPTPPPALAFWRRQDDTDPLTIGPDTCGFEDGDINLAFKCVASTRTCTNDGTYIGCCDPGATCTTAFATACVDLTGYNAGECNNRGNRTICCSMQDTPNCRTLKLDGSLTDIVCVSTTASTGTLKGQPDGFTITTSTLSTDTPSITREINPSDGITVTVTSNPAPIGDGDVDVGEISGDGNKRPPTPAVIGGVAGGVVFVIVIIGAVVYIHRKRSAEDGVLDELKAPAPLVYRFQGPPPVSGANGSPTTQLYYSTPISPEDSASIAASRAGH